MRPILVLVFSLDQAEQQDIYMTRCCDNVQTERSILKNKELKNNKQNKQTAVQTTTKTSNKLDNKQQNKHALKDLKTKQSVKVKGTKKITDMQDLKLFLAKKKLEGVQNGIFKPKNQNVAATDLQPVKFLPSSAHSSDCDRDRTSQTKPAATGDTHIAAKGNTISVGTSDWFESSTRLDSNQ